MPTRFDVIAAAFAFVSAAFLLPLPAGADDATAEDREALAKAFMRPVCADRVARDKMVAEMIEQGGEYEKATAKWDVDITCDQIDLPVDPVHDTADRADDASHSDWIYDARWSPDGKLIATAGRDGTVRLWDVATGKTVTRIDVAKLPPRLKSDQPSHVRAARFLGDGHALVVTADSQPVRIFAVDSGEPLAEVPYTQPDPKWELPPFIETSASGLVVLGGYGGDIVVYDTKAKAERYHLPGIAGEYPRFALSDAAGFLATTKPGKERSVLIQLRKLDTGEQVWEAEAQGGRSADSMAFSRDGKQLAVTIDGTVHIFATDNKSPVKTVQVYPAFGRNEVTFTADGQRIVSGQRHAQLWDIATGKRLRHFGPFSDLCHSVDVSPDGKYLVTGHIGSDGRIWEIDTGTFFRRLGKNVHPPG